MADDSGQEREVAGEEAAAMTEHLERCWKCDGTGCEYNCGLRGGCSWANAGPDSHRICSGCSGRGRVLVPGHSVTDGRQS